MTWQQALIAFAVFSVVITITPGPDTVLVLRSGLTKGREQALAVSAGAATGSVAWGVVAACGAAALLQHSLLAFAALRYSGAAYLAYLGVRTLLETGSPTLSQADHRASSERPDPDSARDPIGHPYRVGLLSDLLSPKAGLYFLAILPQFVPKGWPPLASMILLAALDGILVLAWLSFLACAAFRAGNRFQHPRFRKTISLACGSSLIGLGIAIVFGNLI